MEDLTINPIAVFVCALASLALGALWYSPLLFYRGWRSETGLSEEQLSSTNPLWGATAGFLAGFGWCTLIFAVIALFEQRSWRYILINGGFITIYFTLIGFILGLWR